MTKRKFNTILTLDLKNFFRSKGIDKPVGWMMKQGISNDVAHKLLNGKFKRGVPLHHLATICQKLWCTPNDLLAYNPETPQDDQPTHPLQALKRKPENTNVNEMIKKLPREKLDEIKKMLENMTTGEGNAGGEELKTTP